MVLATQPTFRLPPRPLVAASTAFAHGDQRSWVSRSSACWSTSAEDLVLFVHGFGGDGLRTWRRFMDLWPLRPGDDLVFYGYESVRRQVHYMATEFHAFLDFFLTAPARTINPTVAHLERWYPGSIRAPHFAYRRVVIVAHSLGAIVARRALLDADAVDRRWLANVRLVLFAPAHKGAYIAKLVSSALTGVTLGAPFASLAKLYFKSLEGLEKDSQELRDLERDTFGALKRRKHRPKHPLAASAVVLPQWESIVIQGQFAQDAPATEAPGCDHGSVCKPRENFLAPIVAVREAL